MTEQEIYERLLALGVKYAVLDTGTHQRHTMGPAELAAALAPPSLEGDYEHSLGLRATVARLPSGRYTVKFPSDLLTVTEDGLRRFIEGGVLTRAGGEGEGDGEDGRAAAGGCGGPR